MTNKAEELARLVDPPIDRLPGRELLEQVEELLEGTRDRLQARIANAVATEGVECRKDKEVLDETPGAYKDIDAVMAAQSDLVDIVHVLKQVVCIKG